MKKTLFNSEGCYLYVGIDGIYGEFILETEGDPITLNDLEEGVADRIDECEKFIENINNIISDPNTYWEPCDEEDEDYVSGWLSIWGIHD